MEWAVPGLLLLVVILAAAVFWAVHAKQCQERDLEEIIHYLEEVQDGRKLPEWQTFREGRTGILQSEIYKMVMRLQDQTQQAEKDREYLEKMMSDISHQIRTPLTSVTVMTELLKEPQLPEEKRIEFAGRIDSQIDRINWLVRNLLTLSRLEANVLRLKREDVTAQTLLEDAAEPFLLLADVKDISLLISADPEIRLICDRHWTREALSNIVKNCLEHTPEGGSVTLTAAQSNLSTSIEIRDNGCGINPEDLPHIFERFYRGKHASSQSVGIGLALSRQIIMQQNGTIEAESEPGCGARFLVRFYS